MKTPGFEARLEKLPCTLMARDVYKIRRDYSVLEVPIQIKPLGGTKTGKPSPPVRIEIVIACLQIILRDVLQIVCNSPLRSSSSILKSTQPTNPLE